MAAHHDNTYFSSPSRFCISQLALRFLFPTNGTESKRAARLKCNCTLPSWVSDTGLCEGVAHNLCAHNHFLFREAATGRLDHANTHLPISAQIAGLTRFHHHCNPVAKKVTYIFAQSWKKVHMFTSHRSSRLSPCCLGNAILRNRENLEQTLRCTRQTRLIIQRKV